MSRLDATCLLTSFWGFNAKVCEKGRKHSPKQGEKTEQVQMADHEDGSGHRRAAKLTAMQERDTLVPSLQRPWRLRAEQAEDTAEGRHLCYCHKRSDVKMRGSRVRNKKAGT